MRKGIYKDPVHGTWYINVKVHVGNKLKVCKIRGYETKSQADADYERAVNAWIKDHEDHWKVMFFSDLVEQSKETRSLDVKLQTYRTDLSIFNKYLSYFNSFLIKDVFKQEVIMSWYRDFTRRTDVSTARKNKVITCFKRVLAYAYQHLYVDAQTYQVCDIILKKVRIGVQIKEEKTVWTREEFETFLDHIPTNKIWYPFFLLFGELGCRIGEIQGLMWKHFDPVNKTIYICQQVIEGTGEGIWKLDTPKTTASIRYDKLTDDMVSLLLELKRIEKGEDNEFIFNSATINKSSRFNTHKGTQNEPISRSAIRRALYKYIALAGVPRITPHGLRHSNTSWLCSQVTTVEDVKVISKRLGHSSTQVTLDTYAHILNSKENEMVNNLSTNRIRSLVGEKNPGKVGTTRNDA